MLFGHYYRDPIGTVCYAPLFLEAIFTCLIIVGMRHTSAYTSASNAKFLCKDVEPMVKKVTLLQLLIDHEVPRIMELFEDYKQELISHISSMNEVS